MDHDDAIGALREALLNLEGVEETLFSVKRRLQWWIEKLEAAQPESN